MKSDRKRSRSSSPHRATLIPAVRPNPVRNAQFVLLAGVQHHPLVSHKRQGASFCFPIVLALGGLLLLGLARQSNAASITIQVTGIVSNVVGNPFDFGLTGGESFSGLFTYDPATPPAFPRTDQNIYYQATSYLVNVAGHQFKGTNWFVFMSNDTFGDFFEFSAGSEPAGYGTVILDGVPNPQAGFIFGAQDTTAIIFTSVALPGSPFPPLNAFDVTNIGLFSDNSLGPRAEIFDVTVTGLQEVPQPAGPLLRIALTATNTVFVAWPAAWTGASLQQNSNLGSTNWVNVTNAVKQAGSESFAIVSPSAGNHLYRLKH